MNKIFSVLLVLMLVATSFFVLFNSKNIFSDFKKDNVGFNKSVSDFSKIWYDSSSGFNKNGNGVLILAVTYDDNTFREIDDCTIVFHNDPFFFSVLFEDDAEPMNGYFYLKKSVVLNYFPDDIKQLANKNFNYKTIQYNGSDWFRISVPDFNREYTWKKYTEPVVGEKWYIWGSDESISLKTRAMSIEQKLDETGILLYFTHPTDTSGQVVYFNKDWLSSTYNISNPVFEWQDGNIWRSLDFSKEGDYYTISPEHFSTIGVHESASGTTVGEFPIYLYDTQYDGDFYVSVWGDGTYIYALCSYDGIRAYTFNENTTEEFWLKDTQLGWNIVMIDDVPYEFESTALAFEKVSEKHIIQDMQEGFYMDGIKYEKSQTLDN